MVYDMITGELIIDRTLGPGDPIAEISVMDSRTIAQKALMPTAVELCIYDGDTGQRWTPDMLQQARSTYAHHAAGL